MDHLRNFSTNIAGLDNLSTIANFAKLAICSLHQATAELVQESRAQHFYQPRVPVLHCQELNVRTSTWESVRPSQNPFWQFHALVWGQEPRCFTLNWAAFSSSSTTQALIAMPFHLNLIHQIRRIGALRVKELLFWVEAQRDWASHQHEDLLQVLVVVDSHGQSKRKRKRRQQSEAKDHGAAPIPRLRYHVIAWCGPFSSTSVRVRRLYWATKQRAGQKLTKWLPSELTCTTEFYVVMRHGIKSNSGRQAWNHAGREPRV